MLVMMVQIIIPVGEIDDRIIALILFVVLFLWNFKLHFGSVFKIINLEQEILGSSIG
jgi:hypothetical protein